MIEKIIYISLIVIFFLIIFSHKTCEKFYLSIDKKKKYIPQYIGPIIFKDYNDNKIGTYPDDRIWDSFFEKKNGKYIGLLGAGEVVEIKFPKSEGGTKGPDGFKGLKGDQGPIGNKGITTTGEIGRQGPPGIRGERGKEGSCPICVNGSDGAIGTKGPVGPRGEIGERGRRKEKSEAEKGLTGDVGAIGPTGLMGHKGPTGNVGPIGPKGDGGDVFAIQGARGLLNKNIYDNYLQINRQENLNAYDNIKIGNNNTRINITSSKPIINKTSGELCIKKNSAESCINKNDIKNLYEFNNPISTCPNGIKVDESTFNGVECKSCKNGFYLKQQKVNGKFLKNKLTKICEKCITCEKNFYAEGCSGKNPGTCKSCGGCPGGFRHGCGGISKGTCVACNKKACPPNTYEVSRSCNSTHNGPTCHQCKNNTCPAGQHSASYTCYHGPHCIDNICSCPGGTGSKGRACPANGQHHCASCGSKYTKTHNKCHKNEITVYENAHYGGASRTFSGENGTAIKLKDYTMKGSTNWKDEISSYKKHPYAMINFHGRDNNWPDHGGDWADLYNRGNNPWIGDSWNDEIDVISFGTGIPTNWKKRGNEDPI